MSGLTHSIERPVKERVRDWKEIHTAIPLTVALREAVRCNYCHESPCSTGCPSGVDVSAFIRRINVGDLRGAIRIIREANPFAGVCGRICPAENFCIAECRNRLATSPLAIAVLQRFAADEELLRGVRVPEVKRAKNAKRIAVVGAGPAGLTCASELAKRGYAVTVFEARKRPGGMLTFGIPSYRLSQEIVDAEIDQIKKLGVTIKPGTRVANLKKLKAQGYAAIFVGIGAWKSHTLNIPGAKLQGVWDALDFIASAKLQASKPRVGKTVVILGGGNTAMDCAGTALRLGTQRVIIAYRRGMAEMPAWGSEIELTFKEGAEFLFLTAPKRILGKKRVEGIECIKMKLGPKDESGRPRPVPVPGSEFIIEADTVIQAVGQGPDAELLRELGLAVDKRGCIKAHASGLTSLPGVFAGGDAVNGGATAVEAIAAGKKTADAIDKYIRRK